MLLFAYWYEVKETWVKLFQIHMSENVWYYFVSVYLSLVWVSVLNITCMSVIYSVTYSVSLFQPTGQLEKWRKEGSYWA